MHICPNKKVYIGITSKNVNTRWQNGKGYPNNPYFTNAILKYGWDNIQHIILFEDGSYVHRDNTHTKVNINI